KFTLTGKLGLGQNSSFVNTQFIPLKRAIIKYPEFSVIVIFVEREHLNLLNFEYGLMFVPTSLTPCLLDGLSFSLKDDFVDISCDEFITYILSFKSPGITVQLSVNEFLNLYGVKSPFFTIT